MDVQVPLIQKPLNADYPMGTYRLTTNNNSSVLSSSTIENLSRSIQRNIDTKINRNSNDDAKQMSTSNKFFDAEQMKSYSFYQALISEFIGTLLLTLVCTSTGLPIASQSVPDINGALASGFITATIIVGFSHISGAHINPAVTVSFIIVGSIDLLRALLYIGMQLLGAASASYLLKLITPSAAQANLGMTIITNGVNLSQACIVETIITFILCYTVHSICDEHRTDIGGSKAFAVGLAVSIGCLFGGPYTGASMNPARSFGPAVVMNSWKNHWIYWLGPMLGSIIAALLYTRILKRSSSTKDFD
jgi:MIP family channel proteins